jgi:glycosyltransferase involved in cell wall biosynthesis
MRYLFIHQNFPGQYRHIVQRLADQGHEVRFITQPNDNAMAGVTKITYPKDARGLVNCHYYALDIDRAVAAGSAVAETCRTLKEQGFTPDLIVGHAGWGETLFVKDIYPDVPVLANFEFFFHVQGADVNFDPEFVSVFNDPLRLRMRNATALLAFRSADWGHSATSWQRSLHPADVQTRISVLHEGVDTDQVRPNIRARFRLPDGRSLTSKNEVVTYVARNLEPYRGFHTFMRCLPQLLRRRPHAQIVIVGGDGVSYGAPPPPRSTFREMLLAEVGSRIDTGRVHFVGVLDYAQYLTLLQVSGAHVYLTYPFVLSWSCIEALATGCLVIGSETAPVLEVLRDGVNGLTVDFFSPRQLANRIESVLAEPKRYQELRQAARARVLRQFDLRQVVLPRWSALFDDLIERRTPAVSLPSENGNDYTAAGPSAEAKAALTRRSSGAASA